jgi:hypothetical protein
MWLQSEHLIEKRRNKNKKKKRKKKKKKKKRFCGKDRSVVIQCIVGIWTIKKQV